MYFSKLNKLKDCSIPFIPVFFDKKNNSKIVKIFISKFNEFLYVNNNFIDEITDTIVLKKIYKNNNFFGYIALIEDTSLFENNSYYNWNFFYLYKKNDLFLDNILYNSSNTFEYISLKDIFENVF